ncbi:hypothetical protein GPLA_3253 [Paraglaciecola polaris LMG 21857]|uniref:Uncharacterized protein n=1 Tax=Paraglaciecola polaris LMG 21857 TaxID=1129793 RepID=K6ZZG9_9ALTE|nr:hypothetical protein GPLA_3253 [Paraglaciecola polaris LMG 21857]
MINSQNGKLDDQEYLIHRFQMWVKKGGFFILFSYTTTVFLYNHRLSPVYMQDLG